MSQADIVKVKYETIKLLDDQLIKKKNVFSKSSEFDLALLVPLYDCHVVRDDCICHVFKLDYLFDIGSNSA